MVRPEFLSLSYVAPGWAQFLSFSAGQGWIYWEREPILKGYNWAGRGRNIPAHYYLGDLSPKAKPILLERNYAS